MIHRPKKRCNGAGFRGCAYWDNEICYCGIGFVGSIIECDNRGFIILCDKWKSIEEARIENKEW